jgi:hypothetical protein
MYAGRNRKASAFDKKTAQPVKISRPPKYIGLRETVYTPPMTNEEVESGFIGLTVVCAFQNVTTPEMPVTKPTAARVLAKGFCAGNAKANAGANRETSHISTATTNTKAGGGTFNSRTRMSVPQEH